MELTNYYSTFYSACQVLYAILCYFFVIRLWLDFSGKEWYNKKEDFDFGGSMKLSRTEVWKHTRNILLVIAGTIVLAFGTAVFLLPFNLIAGGMSGLAIVIDAIVPAEFLTVDVIITILTWGLFFLGLLVFGKGFAAKTLISAIVYPMGTSLFLKLTDPNVLGGVFCLQASGYTELPLIIAATVGGALVGVGCSLTFFGGGSTGGTDIIAFILCKIFKRLKSSTAMFLTDVTIVILGIFITQDLIISLLGVVSAMIIAIMIDKIFLGGTSAFVAQIVTDYGEEVNRAIIDQANRTTTIFDVRGGYSGKDKKMLTITFSIRHYTLLMDIVRSVDPSAFVTIWRAHEIHGEGWTWNKE